MNLLTRFYLGSPLYLNANSAKQPPTLDAIMSFLWMQQHGYKKTPAELSRDSLVFADLPIRHRGKCYLASCMFLPPNGGYTKQDCLTKRGNVEYRIGRTCTEFKQTGKAFTPAILKHTLLFTPYVDFFVSVEDDRMDEFKDMLKAMKTMSIGAKASVGYGRIIDIQFAPAPDGNESYFRDKNGFPTRPLPVALFKKDINPNATIGMATYYAPYWFHGNMTPCFLPQAGQAAPLPVLDEAGYQAVLADMLVAE